jgi:hypothetical protein
MTTFSLPQTSHECFPQPADGQTKVWRHMDLAKFVDLLATYRLYLPGLGALNDPHEESLPAANVKADRPAFRAMAAKFNRAL